MYTWQQGRTLITEQTCRWSQEEWAENEARERKLVFAHFSSADRGRSRVLIAECRLAEDAATIVRLRNTEVRRWREGVN